MHIPVNQILCGTVVRLSKLVKQGAQRHHEMNSMGKGNFLLSTDVEIKDI